MTAPTGDTIHAVVAKLCTCAGNTQFGHGPLCPVPVVESYGRACAATALNDAADHLDWSWQWASNSLRPTLRHVEAGLRARAEAIAKAAEAAR